MLEVAAGAGRRIEQALEMLAQGRNPTQQEWNKRPRGRFDRGRWPDQQPWLTREALRR
jgi:hypothetical protein